MLITGNETVDAIGQLHLEGNIIPHKWFDNIRFENGKPDLTSIIILSEIIYWYRPAYEKDEKSGQLLGAKKRFKSDLLQRSYDSFSDQFGITKRQAKDAVFRLERLGFIKRHFRTIEANNTKLGNVLFIELLHENVIAMTFQCVTSDIKTSEVLHLNVTPITVERQTNTEITTETTTNKKINSRKQAFDDDSQEMVIVNFFIQEITKNRSGFKLPNKQNWCKEIDKLIRIDNRNPKEICLIIRFAQNHEFWKSNVLSPASLRKNYDRLCILFEENKKKQTSTASKVKKEMPKPVQFDLNAGED